MAGLSHSGLMQAVAEFSAEEVQKEFQEAYAKGELEATLHKHWSQYVPAVYIPTLDPDPAREERKAKRVLFRPLESFLCGGAPEPDAILRSLKDRDNPPQLCGRVFKNGEPTYSCRDCGMDPTCVLCIECFQHSAHRKHRYKMSTSGGAGYCDCGDVEAWKSEPFCDIHKRGATKKDKECKDPVQRLDEDMVVRARQVFLITVRYAVNMLTWQHPDRLPATVQPEHVDNTYSTILFNDEIHTYDQVISSLQRAIDCTHKEAVDFATTVDREGRSCIRNGAFNECEVTRQLMEKNTSRYNGKPLKVLVMHTSVVSHQTFSQKILGWLQHTMNYSDGLRQLFCQLSMAKHDGEEASLVERVMLADTQLWKAARILSHQLFMAGVLMDQDCKKQFAILFTKNYPALLNAFIQDDHARAVSMASSSVQMFTVPTLARMLISEHNLLQIILDTFLTECESKKNEQGKFSLERHSGNQTFRRAQYILYDLKYAMTVKPLAEEWNDRLRTNFMNGFRSMLDLLKCMQCMDSVVRQTGQHIEYEPEWDGAFNLQIKLADNIAEILEWCSTDESVLVQAFTATNEALFACRDRLDNIKMETHTVAGHSAECIKYDVSTQPVSIHLPVTRLLAGLYPLMHKLNLSLPELQAKTKLSLVEIMEPALRTQVMIAQSQAGMWRRNGYSLLNQIYFYSNVRCRKEMADKDLLMLQAAGALMESNEFLVHLLNKYCLLNWIKEDYDSIKLPVEDLVRQTVTVAEEFLLLLIHIVSERFTIGLGQVDGKEAVKREIIHQLCIQPMAHSELTKALPEDPNHETGIEDTVHEVAKFWKPTGEGGKGQYELKPECYKEYNPFFYHYVRAEQSKAEEAQKKRKKNNPSEDQALPPPYPPPFVAGFSNLIHLLDSDVMLCMMKNVLERTAAAKSRSWSESQLERVLHLIGLALHEQRRCHEDFKFMEKATSGKRSLFTVLETLVGNANLSHDSQKALLSWVIKMFRELRGQHDSTFMDSEEAGPSSAPSDTDTKQEEERKKKAEMAAQRRARIMAQMSKMQRDFIKENAYLFQSADTGGGMQPATSDMDLSIMEEEDTQPVALGPNRSTVSPTGAMKQTCILCQEEQIISHSAPSMVIAAFTQRSTVLSKDRGTVMTDGDTHDPLFVPSTLIEGAHTTTCTHVMHSSCWQRFYDGIVRGRRRTARYRQRLSYDVEKVEFLCPLCETLSNTVIPLIPPLVSFVDASSRKHIELSLNDWLDGLQKTVRCSIQEHKDRESDDEDAFFFVPCPLSGVTKMMADSVAKNFQLLFEYVYLDSSDHFADSIMQMLKKFASDVYAVGLGVNPDDENIRVPVMAWSTCAYTIMAAEQSLRDEGKPLFGALASRKAECVSAVVRFAAVCSQVIQPDIVKKHCVTLLSATILGAGCQKLQETPAVLDIEMFHYLVMLCLSLPALYTDDTTSGASNALSRIPTGDLNDQHVLQLVLTAHLIQILLSADFSNFEEDMETETDAEGEALVRIYTQLRHYAKMEVGKVPSAWHLSVYIRTACLPFLRCATLFFHYLTGVRPPPKLTEHCEDEMEAMCHYLALPLCPVSLLTEPDSPLLHQIVQNWCSEVSTVQKLSAGTTSLVKYPLQVNQLMPLPHDYSQLINKVCTFTCPKSEGDDSRAPTMCLVCGKMLCSQSYCCQTDIDGETVGAATAHTITCGAGTGMFLRVRECQVLLLSNRGKGCFFEPPYLDDYGETDQGLRRGNPLHLCMDRYRKLQRLWLSHSVMEEIAHSLESNTNLHTIDWQHL